MAQPPLSSQTPPSIPNSSSSSSSSSSTPASSPAPPLSYAVNQNINASGNSHQPPSHSVSTGMKPNSAANPPIHNLPPHAAAPSFSYNFPQSAAAFAANQHAQPNTAENFWQLLIEYIRMEVSWSEFGFV
ncbi:pre-mRNA-processing protein 40C [Trifolium pratense]|uniref:Pre-mRNA-processing protein 40C n=1 Tax=Trifolium pratense TaxID=57577 RepID=A0A2K3NN74_TRIPR|nr:pre-mRNA-processing protein 40C [Trifolium pratense]